ncbi:alpha-galactosidase [Protaetiibacter intestinalis]|uniref:Alpha-galactosidase n=1 Tax=Protaetiibacter intestinalis TaxID=2419774 RepID=A0A387B467_9MICO|nr:alpha-galactosidase [Protaetiibacter intestinalis]AYF98382.1 alpha-galactosidase [Protaetiibacter intestinalis]
MIEVRDDAFLLQTRHTSYWFARTAHGHLEHLHYGPLLPPQDPEALRTKRALPYGSSVVYAPDDEGYSLDAIPLEFSGIGQGDYRLSPIEVFTAFGADVDLVYRGHRIREGATPAETLPTADGGPGVETLEVTLADERAGLELTLLYTVFPDEDVITRRTVLRNTGAAPAEIARLASLQLDLPDRGFTIRSFDGGWIHEAHAHDRPVSSGVFSIGSTTGASSNRHNPGLLLIAGDADEHCGWAYGFNLVYSGNHATSVERDAHGSVRVRSGIQPQAFRWPLAPGEAFEAPEAVLAFSDEGLNGLSDRMHRFVRAHITPERYRGLERPVVYNSWEAAFFDIDEKRLRGLAKQAAKLGVELFVIDDGWFAGRGDDRAALGDYAVDERKFPSGLGAFVKKVAKLGMRCGIWVEPEMVSEDSELYRAHPDWALRIPGKPAREGRHQQVLDLCNPEVCDYLVEQLGALIDGAGFDYVKWDMNRHIADAYSPHVPHPGMTAHRYLQNLYRVIARVLEPRPHVLLEMCSSGGNRFDLGMLRSAAVIWASDDTDPIERLDIQQGLSYLYPPSVVSAHVSASPHQQTLRDTPLSTRFNVAAFGCLGYEYDLDFLTAEEKREITEQIAFYKAHRTLFQFGRFRRGMPGMPTPAGRVVWQVDDGDTTLVGNFQRGVRAAPERDLLAIAGLEPGIRYRVTAKPQRVMLERLGHLVNHVSPVRVDPNGLVMNVVSRHRSLPDGVEQYTGTGELLASGIRLELQFSGTGHHATTRMLGDHGSTLYLIERIEREDDA